MNPFKEFAAFEGKVYAATTKRVYLSAAKKALKIVDKTPEECGSYEERLALLRENLTQKKVAKSVANCSAFELFGFKNPQKCREYSGLRPHPGLGN